MDKLEIISTIEQSRDPIIFNGETFSYKSEGLTRRVYVNEDKTQVIKICVERENYFNEEEYKLYQESKFKQDLAITTNTKEGFIIQEYLHTFDDEETQKLYPRLTMEQIKFAKSCREDVGFDKDGNLKCFDIAEYKQY